MLTILLTKGTGVRASTLTTWLCGCDIEGGMPEEKKAIKGSPWHYLHSYTVQKSICPQKIDFQLLESLRIQWIKL